jgi:hypothetical protein
MHGYSILGIILFIWSVAEQCQTHWFSSFYLLALACMCSFLEYKSYLKNRDKIEL